MSTVNRNGGLGGLWPKPVKRENGAPAKNDNQVAKKAGDTAQFSFGTNRLSEFAGDFAQAVSKPTGPAANLVRESKSLGDLIDKALAHSLGRPVNLGKHKDSLVKYVESSLQQHGYPTFDDLKNKLG